MKNNYGQNLTEFVIIIAVIAIGAIVAYSLLGKEINQLFTNSEKKVSDFKPFKINYDPATGKAILKAGDLGGTESKPVTNCNGDSCNIDYGTFILTGVPADFTQFVETSGTSSSTDKIASLLEQIASQIEETQPSEASELKDMANYSHVIAYLQKQIEQKAKQCSSVSDPKRCLRGLLHAKMNESITLPAEYKSIVPNFESTQGDRSVKEIMGYNTISSMRYIRDHVPANQTVNYPSMEFINTYDKINDPSNKLSPAIKDVAKELYLNVNDLSILMSDIVTTSYTVAGPQYVYDPFTPTVIPGVKRDQYVPDTMEDITNPQLAEQTNQNASVLCYSGRDQDNGNKCY